MKFILKKRLNSDHITIPTDILSIIKDPNISPIDASEALYNFLNEMIKGDITIHDKVWLTMIVNWTPPNTGLSMIDIAKWITFAKRVENIDENKDKIEFSLSDSDAKMIFEKLNNPEFKILRISTSLLNFLDDLQTITELTISDEKIEK